MNATKLEPVAYAALRIVSGFAFALHGVQKVFGVLVKPDYVQPALLSQKGVGGLIELVCGALIMLGLFTRPAAFLASGTMAVAYIQFHWKGALDERFFPISAPGNGGELALIYCFLFLLLFAKGAGALSLDRMLRRG